MEYADKSPRKPGQSQCDPYCGCQYYDGCYCLQFGPYPPGLEPKSENKEKNEEQT